MSKHSDSTVAPLLPSFPVIPNLLPRYSVSLLVGASYVGKTALLLPAIDAYLSSHQFLGTTAPRHPDSQLPMLARVGYLACDRTLSEVAATLADLALPALTADRFPYLSWQDSRPTEDTPTFQDLYEQFPSPRPQLLIVEAFQTLMPSGKLIDYQDVMRFYASIKRYCRIHDITILATVATSKTGTGEDYHTPTALGSVAWDAGCATRFTLELVDAAKPAGEQTSMRILTTQPRRRPPSISYWDFNDQMHLVPAPGILDWRTAFLQRLQAIPLGQPIPRTTFLAWGESAKIGKTMVDDWISHCIDTSILERIKQGMFRRPYQT